MHLIPLRILKLYWKITWSFWETFCTTQGSCLQRAFSFRDLIGNANRENMSKGELATFPGSQLRIRWRFHHRQFTPINAFVKGVYVFFVVFSFFDMDHFLSLYWISYNIVSVLCVVFSFGWEAFGILAPQPGIKPAFLILKGKILITELKGKSLKKTFFNWRIIALQNFVVFCQISTWIRYRYTYVPSLWSSLPSPSPSYLSRLLQGPYLSSLNHTSNSHWYLFYIW